MRSLRGLLATARARLLPSAARLGSPQRLLRLGNPGAGVLYAASKGALNSLTIGLSQEVAGEGIRVNTVAPGLTATDMPPPDKLATLGPAVPIGRVAQPEEIAEAIVWLLSDKASYTAGANIRVGGGRI